jgi:hypothetical protein
MQTPLTLESGIEFCLAIASGKEPPIPDEFGDPIDRVTSQNAEVYVANGWSLVGFCEDDSECIRNLSFTKRELRIRGMNDIVIASFPGRITEWPLPLRSVSVTTAAVLFVDSALVATFSGDMISPETLSDQIFSRRRLIGRDAL